MCHAHPSDGSLHLTLHPADAKVLLEMGWGERHPLAKGGWFRRFVPREFVLVYAPRTEGDVGVVMDVVAAAVWWVSGVDVKAGGEAKSKSTGIREGFEAEGGSWGCRADGCGPGGRRMEKMMDEA